MSIPGSASPLFLSAAAAEEAAAGPIKSLRFNDDDSAYLSKSFSGTGNQKTWTLSMWVKRGNLGLSDTFLFESAGTTPELTGAYFDSSDKIYFRGYASAFTWRLQTSRVFRDPSAWYHLVFVFDSTNSTSGDRVRLYVNGIRETVFDNEDYPSQNHDSGWNYTGNKYIGSYINPSNYFDGYIADVYSIDGSALDPTSFGAFDDNGVWQAAAYSGTYGTNGFHLLDFANESTIGHDSSGNENDFTAVNFSTTVGAGNDVLFDVPTNGTQSDTGAGGEVSGNYATWNPLDKATAGTLTISNGNLDVLVQSGSSTYPAARLTITPVQTSGKYQWEITIGTKTASYWQMGLNISANVYSTGDQHATFRSDGFYSTTITGATWSGTPPAFTQGDIITVAYDADSSVCKFYKNGVLGPTLTLTTIPANLNFGVFADSTAGNANYTLNAGQRPFAYPVTGYKPLCTTNLPTPTIADGSDYFDAKLYTGNSSTQSISGYDFSPDFVWMKGRSGARNHGLFNTVTGVNKGLHSNLTDAEFNDSSTLTAFNSDGFSLSTNVTFNANNETFVAWAWDAGSSTASNTDGSITSNVRANQTAGFSVVTYSGDGSTSGSVGHGLNATPGMVIVKARNATKDWKVAHTSLASTHMLTLNQTYATGAASWNGVTSSVFYPARSGDTYNNTSGENYVAYCFAPVAGFSAFGEFDSNNSTDNAFIHTGFAPRWLIWKNTNGGGWFIYDAARNTYNPRNSFLAANTNDAEADATPGVLDFLSNGFKVRNTLGGANPFIWAAFASNPFQANGGLAR